MDRIKLNGFKLNQLLMVSCITKLCNQILIARSSSLYSRAVSIWIGLYLDSQNYWADSKQEEPITCYTKNKTTENELLGDSISEQEARLAAEYTPP